MYHVRVDAATLLVLETRLYCSDKYFQYIVLLGLNKLFLKELNIIEYENILSSSKLFHIVPKAINLVGSKEVRPKTCASENETSGCLKVGKLNYITRDVVYIFCTILFYCTKS